MLQLIPTDRLYTGDELVDMGTPDRTPRGIGVLDERLTLLDNGDQVQRSVLVDSEGWVRYGGRPNSVSLCVYISHAPSRLPTSIPDVFKVYAGFRVRADNAGALKNTSFNAQRGSPLDDIEVVLGNEYYVEMRVTVSATANPIVDTWLNGIRLPQWAITHTATIALMRSGLVEFGLPYVASWGSRQNTVDGTPIRDIYVGNDQYPNPMSGRLGPIVVESKSLVQATPTVHWSTSNPDASINDTINAPIISNSDPWVESVSIANDYEPLELRIPIDEIADNVRYAAIQVNYHGTRIGDSLDRAQITVSNQSNVMGADTLAAGPYKYLGAAFIPNQPLGALTSQDVADARVLIGLIPATGG